MGQVLAHDPRHVGPAILEVVCGRSAQRQLQLRRQASRRAQEQGGVHLGIGAGGRGRQGNHIPGALRTRQRVRGAAQGLRRTEGGRPRDPPHAHDARVAGHNAGVRPAGRRPLTGVRRLQWLGVRRPDSRLRQQRPHHHGRLPPQRRYARPQGQGRRGSGPGRGERRQGRQGPRVAPLQGAVPVRHPHGRGQGLLRRRDSRGLQGRPGRSCLHARRGAPVPDVHERHDRQAQRARSTAPAATSRT